MDIILASTASGEILLAKEVYVGDAVSDGTTQEGMAVDAMAGAEVKDPLLSSWPFVIGISALVLAVSVALGILLAKRKIKKGIELYED